MEGFDISQIITGLCTIGFVIFCSIEMFKKLSDYFGWFKKRKNEKQEKQQKELEATIIPIIEKSIEISLKKINEQNLKQEEKLDCLIESSNDMMRHEMTKIYYKYLPYQKILQYDKESFNKLYRDYHTQHGNTFIDDINMLMTQWPVVLDEKDLI